MPDPELSANTQDLHLEAHPHLRFPSPERRSLVRRIQRRIVLGIQLGELPPGATLSEPQLADALHVPGTMVRESLIGLESAGHLERSEGSRALRVPALSARDAGIRYETLGGLMRLATFRWGLPGHAALAELEELRRTLMASSPETWLLRHESRWTEVVCGCWHSPALARLTRTMADLVCRYEIAYLRDRGRMSPPTHAQKPAMLQRLQAGDADAAIAELDRTWSARADEIKSWLRETSDPYGS